MYDFEIDFSDSTAVYDIYFYTRTDCARASSVPVPLRLDIWWVAPSQSVYDESVFMKTGDYRGLKQLYRKGVVPSENGVWKLCVKPDNVPPHFRGLGVVCDKNGTR